MRDTFELPTAVSESFDPEPPTSVTLEAPPMAVSESLLPDPPKSETFCGTCGALALPGVHPNPDCNRHVPAPGDNATGTTEDKPTSKTEVSPDQAAALVRYAVQAAEGEAQLNPRPDGETPADYTRRLVTTAVLRLVEQQLLVIPSDLEQRLARVISGT